MKKKMAIILGMFLMCLLCSAGVAAQAKMVRLVKGHKVVLKGNVREGDEKGYIFTARKGQHLTVKLIGKDAVFSLFGGAVYSDSFANETKYWSGRLPEGDEDNQYAITLTSNYKVASYTIEFCSNKRKSLMTTKITRRDVGRKL